MFKRNYYYLVSGLPDIILDQKKIPFSVSELKEELEYHLHPDDYKFVQYLFLQYDNYNFLNILLKNEFNFNPLGNYSQQFFEEEIKEPSKLPSYMQTFLAAHLEGNPLFPKLSMENSLTWLYYDFMLEQNNIFIREWFSFLRNVNNIFAVYNSRKYDLILENQIIGDYDLTEAAKRTASKDFGLANEITYIDKLINIYENNDLADKEKSIELLKWNYLDELNTFNYFSIERILAFTVKFIMIERWSQLNAEQSKEMFGSLLNDLEKCFKFPKDFNINEKRR